MELDRFLLSVLPGVAAAVGGLIMLFSTRRSVASFGGLLALAGGLWFIAGPSVSMLWNDGIPATGAAIGDNGHARLEWIGFYYGTGALITLFSAYGLGFLAALPIAGEAVPATAATTTAAAGGEPIRSDREVVAAEAPRRRRFLRRPGAAREREEVGPRR